MRKPKPPTAPGHIVRSVFVGVAVSLVVMTIITVIESSLDRYMNPALFVLIHFLVTFGATVYAGHWFIEQYRKHGYWPVESRRSVTPSDFPDAGDPLAQHVMAQTWNTGEPHVGFYDDDGKMHFRQTQMPRVPVVIYDKHGNPTTDAFAEWMAMLDDGVVAIGIKSVTDLDGNPVPIPPGGRVEGDIPGYRMTGDEYRGDD